MSYGVFADANRHSCIRVLIGHKHTHIIPFDLRNLRVVRISTREFERNFKALPTYDVRRAAEIYQQPPGAGAKGPEISREAAAHFAKIRRLTTVQLAALSTAPVTTEEEDPAMATAKKTAATPAAKKTAAPAAKKTAAPAAKKTAPEGRRGRAPNLSDTARITIVAAANPKRGSAAERYALYKNGMTVAEYIAAGGKRADVNWDAGKGWIKVA